MKRTSLEVAISRKAFPDDYVVLSSSSPGDLSFDLSASKIICIFGPSGCGKSTLLKIIAGIDTEYTGRVVLNGCPVTRPGPRVGMVMQEDSSFPWLTVSQNIVFSSRFRRKGEGLQNRILAPENVPKTLERAKEFAELVRLPLDSLGLYPHQLSGGMKQRMLFARSLCADPNVLLLDEAFSSLDYESRSFLQDTVVRVRNELGISFICVSHDPEETLFLADEILFLAGKPARIERRVSPGIQGDRAKLFTVGFQAAKMELHHWILSQRS